MHFSINGLAFFNALSSCFSLSKERVTLEALTNNQVIVSSTGTDLNAALQIKLFAAVKNPGKFQINDAWLNFLRSSKKEDEIVVSTTKQRKKTKTPKTPGMGLYCEVSNGEGFFPVFAPSEEIGGLPFDDVEGGYSLSVSYLQKLSKLSTLTDPKTPMRDVIYLQPGIGYATTGTAAVSIPLVGDFDCAITPKALQDVLRIFKGEKIVGVHQKGSLLYFLSEDKTYVCRTHKSDLARMIATLLDKSLSSTLDVTLPLKDFQQFLEPIKVVCPIIKLSISDNLLTATGLGTESMIELEMPVSYQGEEKEAYFTSGVLTDTLSAFEENVGIFFNGVQPCTFREEKLEAIAMPINPARTVAGVL